MEIFRDQLAHLCRDSHTFAMKLAAGGIPSIRILFVGGEPFSSVEGYPERVRTAFMEKKKCQCGREMTLPKGVLGRTDEMIKVKGVKFWPSQVGIILLEFPELTEKYRIRIYSEKNVDRLELIVEVDEQRPFKSDALAKRLKQETLLAFDRIEVVEKLKESPRVVDERQGRTF